MRLSIFSNYRTFIFVFVIAATGWGADLPSTTEEAQKWEQLIADTPKTIKLSKNVPEAIRMCEEAIAIARNFGPTDTRLSKSLVLRAEIYLSDKKYDLAEQTFKLAISNCEKAVGPNDVALLEPLSSLANFYFLNNYSGAPRYDQMAPLYCRILQILKDSPAKNYREIIRWSRNLGEVYQQLHRYADCEPLYQQSLALAEKTDPEWLPYELLNAADFYRTWGKYDRAEALATRALTIREQALKPGSGVDLQMDVAVCLLHLGTTYLAWSKPAQAEAVYRRSLEMVQPFLAEDQSGLIPQVLGLAAAAHAQGKWDEAQAFYQRTQDLTEKYQGADSTELAPILEKYAALLKEMKKPAEAKVLAERAEKIRSSHKGSSAGLDNLSHRLTRRIGCHLAYVS
jgi:tetratricopeptide (TPR) repeat protein